MDEDAVAHALREPDYGEPVRDDIGVIVAAVGLGLGAVLLALEDYLPAAHLVRGQLAASEVQHTARVLVAAEALLDIVVVGLGIHADGRSSR